MLVTTTFMPVIGIEKKVVETARTGKDSKKSKDGKYVGNLA